MSGGISMDDLDAYYLAVEAEESQSSASALSSSSSCKPSRLNVLWVLNVDEWTSGDKEHDNENDGAGDAAAGSSSFHGCLALLQQEEQQRISRFMFRADAKKALLGRLVIRHYLATRVYDVASSALSSSSAGASSDRPVLARTDFGKPYWQKPAEHRQPASPFARLNFNASHAGRWVLLGADRRRLVGVDVAEVKAPGRKPLADSFLRMVLTPGEHATVTSYRNPHARLLVFMLLWSLKEAFIKALGVGVSFDMKGMDVQFDLRPTPPAAAVGSSASPSSSSVSVSSASSSSSSNSSSSSSSSSSDSSSSSSSSDDDVVVAGEVELASRDPFTSPFSVQFPVNATVKHDARVRFARPLLPADWRWRVLRVDRMHVAAVAYGPIACSCSNIDVDSCNSSASAAADDADTAASEEDDDEDKLPPLTVIRFADLGHGVDKNVQSDYTGAIMAGSTT
jgi:phosphopantetheinyl transferase